MSAKYSAEWWEKVSRNRLDLQANSSTSHGQVAELERERPNPAAEDRRSAGSRRHATRTMNHQLS
jgi:hypothetical protein